MRRSEAEEGGMSRFVVAMLLVLGACKAEVSGPPVVQECKDTRDGEVFQFSSTTVRDVTYNPLNGTVTFTFTDTGGITRYYSSTFEQFWKCKQVKP